MKAAYNNADAIVFTSRIEGMPLAVIEAMRCGLPIIATDGYAMPEVNVDQLTDFLYPLDDADAFVAASSWLSAEQDSYRKPSRAARDQAVSLFSRDMVIANYLAVYRDCLASNAG